METYLQFNPASTIRVEEQVSVRDNRAFLRHIPKKGSVVIDGFTEVDGAPQANQFYCDYATDSLYRDANRVLHFGQVDDFTFLTVNYIAVGTVVTADDMNEIKAHMENQSIHGTHYDLPTMAPNVKGGAKNGIGLVMVDDTVNVDLSTALETVTTSFDEEPRVYVVEEAMLGAHEFSPYQCSIFGQDGVTLQGAPENYTYQLIDGVYYSVWGTVPTECYFPYRGQENFTIRGSGSEIPERDLIEGQDFYVGYDDWAQNNVICFYHDDTDYGYENGRFTNATIWADGHNARQETTPAVANLKIGDNLILEGDTLKASIPDGGAGDKAYFVNNSTKMIATGGLDYNNIDDEYWAINSRIGRGLDESFQSEVGRAPQVGDIVQYYAPGNDVGYTIRTTDKWVNLGYFGENDTSWDFINPLLTIKDRQKLDSLTEPYQIGDEFYLQNNKLHLQTANENTLGGVKVGDGLQLNNSAALCLKAATASQLGGIKIGDGFYLQNNKLHLQTANENTLGGVKVGDGLQLNNSAALCLKAATASQLGGIKIGDGLVKDLHEVLSVELPLSNADRKLLDYLHDQLDDQLD